MAHIEYIAIFHNGEQGRIRIAESGIAWQAIKKENPTTVKIPADDMKWMQWIRVARNFQLRIGVQAGKSDRRRIMFDGFKRDDQDKLFHTIQTTFSITVEAREGSYRGWNWGKTDVQAEDVVFLVGGRPAFDLPLDQIHNVSINKNEVVLELIDPLRPEQSEAKEGSHELVDMRIFIPGAAKSGEKGEGSDDEAQEENGEDDENAESAAQAFYQSVKDKAAIGEIVGKKLGVLDEVLCTTPRGKYDVELFPTFFRLRGKTYDYKIVYKSVKKLFLLSKPDEMNVLFAIHLDPPIRQGQTPYPYVVMQFPRDLECSLDLDIDIETLQEENPRAAQDLKPKYDDLMHNVVRDTFNILTDRRPIVAGKFANHEGSAAVKCNLKANEGFLYILDKSFFFITKHPRQIPYKDVSRVMLQRVGGAMGSARSFDMKIETTGTTNQQDVVFNSIAREELTLIQDFLQKVHIKVKNEVETDVGEIAAALAVDDDDDDVDMADATGDNSIGNGLNDEDEDSEADEDFKADSDDSDVGEEFDENYSSDSGGDGSDDAGGSDADSPPKKKKKDDDGPPKKKQKKA